MDAPTALQNLYMACRLAPLTADQHDRLRESAECLDALVNPKPESPEITEQAMAAEGVAS